jgi:photosystem II stability/assembly factor-like uncharacterized protein
MMEAFPMRVRGDAFVLSLVFLISFSQTAPAQWIQVGTPGGGGITALMAKEEILFAATMKGRVFLSIDGGAKWRPVSYGLPADAACRCLALLGTKIFVGTEEHGVFISENNGGFWKAASAGLPEGSWITFLQTAETRLYAGSGKGLFFSDDNGMDWKEVGGGLPGGKTVSCFAAGEGGFLAIVCEGEVYTSADAGVSWAPVPAKLPEGVHIYCLAASDGKLLAGTELHRMLSYVKGDKKWKSVKGIPASEIYCFAADGRTLFAGTGGGLDVLFQPVVRISHGAGILISIDGAASWSTMNSGLRQAPKMPMLKGRIGFWIEKLAVCGPNLYAGNELGEVWRLSLSELKRAPRP